MKVYVTILLILTCLPPDFVTGKVFTRCGLGMELVRLKFPRSFISNWICLIESESSKDTSKVTTKADGSQSFGLFQINSKEWCMNRKKGGKCNVKCSDLTDEDLSDDEACAKKVYSEKGFRGWDGWVRSCSGRSLYDISRCANWKPK